MVEPKDRVCERQGMEEPPSPKKQKVEEGVPDHHDEKPPQPQPQQGGAAEPPSAPSSSSSVSLGDPSSPHPVVGLDPANKYYKKMLKWLDAELDSPPDNEELMRKDSACVAEAALKHYNEKEGTKYVFDEPFLCCCVLLHPLVILHANFTAREVNSDSSDLFFGEAVQYLGGGSKVLNCVKVDPFAKGGDRNGCVYCRKDIIHPPVEHCEYGSNALVDQRKLQHKTVKPKPSNQ
ncbi:unnamed protein product [Linum tenue]|uniref:DUF3615 domain-containing protein n=1 Tax=Linum tenue TaxID=586396 RepID=A0AAV0LZU6_9ROSI|nr:unnamed protein product [Linum tenue]